MLRGPLRRAASAKQPLVGGQEAFRSRLASFHTRSSPKDVRLFLVGEGPTTTTMTRRMRQGAAAEMRFSSFPKAAAASTQLESSSSENGNPMWEVIMCSLMAFAATATVVASFPSTTTAHNSGSRSNNGGEVTLWNLGTSLFGGNSDNNGGGGGPFLHSMMFASAPLHQEEEPMPINNELMQSFLEDNRGRPYDVSVRAMKGGRRTMEDEFYVAQGGRFAAVFDGHGGGGVSRLLKGRLYDLVRRHLKHWHWKIDETIASKPITPTIAAHVAALRSAFEEVEQDVLKDDSLGYQGSTAVAVLVHESDEGHRTLLSANVGDSRAILSRKGRAVDLTRDHKPNEEREKARILSMGETIEWDNFSKVHRVRNLSLSRAIGDRYAKPTVSSEVEIKHYPVLEDGDEFFLLASDGLWDVMSSQDVVSFVHRRMEKELKSQQVSKDDIEGYKLVLRRNMATFVAREALRRGTGDNVCVLMVWLGDIRAKP